MDSTVCIDGRAAAGFLDGNQNEKPREERQYIDDPARSLSRPPKPVRRKRRLPKWLGRFRIVTEVLWLGVIVVCGIAAIIGLRGIGAEYGVIWVGDR